jgi:hypothetical protein
MTRTSACKYVRAFQSLYNTAMWNNEARMIGFNVVLENIISEKKNLLDGFQPAEPLSNNSNVADFIFSDYLTDSNV